MPKTHWKKLTNPNYLGAYALDEGKDLIATIQFVRREMVTGADGKREECMVVHFVEPTIKPMILNATNAKTITKLYKTPYIEEWANRSIQLYVAQVKAFGEVTDALRIRPYLPKVKVKTETPVACADCGTVIGPYGNMNASQMAQYTQNKYGKPLCADCAKKAAEDKTNVENESADLTAALTEAGKTAASETAPSEADSTDNEPLL